MSKKKLNTVDITNELQRSAFFPQPKTDHVQEVKTEPQSPIEPSMSTATKEIVLDDTVIPRYRDTTTPIHHDTVIPMPETVVMENIRKSVKQIGKESATQRLTFEEVQQLKDIVYTYNRQGVITTKNEIIRIATNYILQDYKTNGENSIVAKVLKILNS